MLIVISILYAATHHVSFAYYRNTTIALAGAFAVGQIAKWRIRTIELEEFITIDGEEGVP